MKLDFIIKILDVVYAMLFLFLRYNNQKTKETDDIQKNRRKNR